MTDVHFLQMLHYSNLILHILSSINHSSYPKYIP